MTNMLKKIAILGGLFALAVSIFWSQDGFNFDIAGDSGYGSLAIFVGYGLAVLVSIMQFVFSTSLNKLNPSLIAFGVLAYAYSIYTNFLGITHFQGSNTDAFGAWLFAIFIDGSPELLIAWGMGESLTGDFLGNLWQAVSGNQKPVHNVNAPQRNSDRIRNKKKYPKPQYPSQTINDDFLRILRENQNK